jgi:heme/copper-type cytochrome/quinol oxidase subunit 2
MLKRIVVCLVMVLVVSVTIAALVNAEPNMQEGQWEISGEMKLEGMPFPMPAVPIQYSQCLTKKDMVPQQREKSQDCKMVSNKMEGNTVTWVMQCKDKNGTTDSTGKVTYKGNTFSGMVHNVTTDSSGAKSTANLQMSGKRIGDCK